MNMRSLFGALALVTLALGCEKKPSPSAGPSAPEGGDTPSFMLASAPVGAISVGVAKRDAAEGEAIVVRGRIGGSRRPFIEGQGAFTLVDAALLRCGEAGVEDGCTTPWDYCCEPRENLVAHTLTVQVVDAAGQVVATGLDGTGGLTPGAEVVVVGTVAPRPSAEVLIVRATGVAVVPEKKG